MSMLSDLNKIGTNLDEVKFKIDLALASSGRTAGSARLVVVTKGQPVEKVQALIDSGGILLGENYPEETARKIPGLKGAENIRWHMIGHIQRRKIKYLVQYFDVIESVESLETSHKLDQKFADAKRTIKILLEVNLSGEQSKQGFALESRERWPEFIQAIRSIMRYQHLEVTGLMTMPPLEIAPEDSRLYFRRCRELGDYVNDQIGRKVISELSMGTSHDYQVALEEGATIVRVGEAIMGPRFYP